MHKLSRGSTQRPQHEACLTCLILHLQQAQSPLSTHHHQADQQQDGKQWFAEMHPALLQPTELCWGSEPQISGHNAVPKPCSSPKHKGAVPEHSEGMAALSLPVWPSLPLQWQKPVMQHPLLQPCRLSILLAVCSLCMLGKVQACRGASGELGELPRPQSPGVVLEDGVLGLAWWEATFS